MSRPTTQTDLFIGGSADGQRKHVLYGDRVQLLAPEPYLAPAGQMPVGRARPEEYRRVTFGGIDRDYDLWVIAGMSEDEAFERMLAKYAGAPL